VTLHSDMADDVMQKFGHVPQQALDLVVLWSPWGTGMWSDSILCRIVFWPCRFGGWCNTADVLVKFLSRHPGAPLPMFDINDTHQFSHAELVKNMS
jgi:hypothetical protein